MACLELPMRAGKRDVEFAIWLWSNDPVRERGRASAVLYVANAAFKIHLASLLPLFMVVGLAWVCGGGLIAFETLTDCGFAALIAYGVGLLGTSLMSFLGMAYAFNKGVRIWIDENPDLEYARTVWPPVRSKGNISALFAMSPTLVAFLVGTLLTPDKWLYHVAAVMSLTVPPILWVAHKTSATSIEDCYGIGPNPHVMVSDD